MTGIWHSTKNNLLLDPNLKKNKILSSDVIIDSGIKKFSTFNNYSTYNEFLEKNKNSHMYEVIYNNTDYPVYMYFDLDQNLNLDTDHDIINNYDSYCTKLITNFIKKFKTFIEDFYEIDFSHELVVGNNIHVGYTPLNPTKPKLSLHVKINIIMNSSNEMLLFATNFSNYLLSNKYNTSEIIHLFNYKKKPDLLETIIDKSVYSNFRSFRLLYSSKITKNLYKTPFLNSSKLIKDHLINVHPENNQNIIDIVIIPKAFKIEGNYKELSKQSISKKKTFNINNSIENSSAYKQIPPHIIDGITKLIAKNKEILSIFKKTLEFNDVCFINDNICRFLIAKNIDHICPYAKRIHSSNRSYFDYNKNKSIIYYGCFNKICNKTQNLISFAINNTYDSLAILNENNNKNTLHCKSNLISWNETYNLPQMKPYPLKSIVAIRANMSIGKTTCLIEQFIKKHCTKPGTKCLFITYQILLSKKYSEELEKYGFVNYLDRKQEYSITDNKIIICLDSLWKIKTLNFDYIFIDEVMSVLLHFNSPLIKDINTLSLRFELLMLQANRIYLLDTCVDNIIVYNMIKYLELKKNIKAYWIRNTHVKETNRNVTLYYNKNAKYKAALDISCINTIIKSLKNNKNIVVCSSTKTFTELLKSKIDIECPEISTIVYNSNTDQNIISNDSLNPNQSWLKYKCLIYSPTISAGISFTEQHFDELVCYAENSIYTASIDNVLQQLFRVRALKNGNMNIFINDSKSFDSLTYPTTEMLVENWLEKHTTDIHSYFPNDSLSITRGVNTKYNDDFNIVFDKSMLSYQTLKSILYNTNKSLHYFTALLTHTLKEDYRINCEVIRFDPETDFIDNANEIMKKYKTSTKKIIEFDQKYLISQEQYEILENIEKNSDQKLNDEQKQQKYTYDVAINIWNLNAINKVNKLFFDNYIGHYSENQKYLGYLFY